MKPPICRLCGRDFRCEWFHAQSGGEVVQFADYVPLPEDYGGTATGCDWFCAKHLDRAKQLASQPIAVALVELESEFGTFPRPVVGNVADPTLWITAIGPIRAEVVLAFRQATGSTPPEARDRLMKLPTLVATGWPTQLQIHKDNLQQCGATVEIRYD